MPIIIGHKSQLREVILNLVDNAVDAMNNTTDRDRVLRIRTTPRGSDAIVVVVEDSGPGLGQVELEGIFDAFWSAPLTVDSLQVGN